MNHFNQLLSILIGLMFVTNSLKAQSENDYEMICKILCIELMDDLEFQNIITSTNEIFVQNTSDYSTNDKRKTVDINDTLKINIWFLKDLFAEGVPYYLKITKIVKVPNGWVVRFNSIQKFGKRNNNLLNVRGEIQVTRSDSGMFVQRKYVVYD